MLQKLRKRQRELEEKQYPDELYGFEAEIYEFLCLLLAVWIMCWRIKGYPGISGVRWRKAFLSCILTYFRI